MELVFSKKQNELIIIFEKLSKISNKYKDYYFFISNFKLEEDKLLELEKVFEEAKNDIDSFNKNFDSNLEIVNYKLQKLKTSKMEKIDMMKEIDEISSLVEKMWNK